MNIPNNNMQRLFSKHKQDYMKVLESVLDRGVYVLGDEVSTFERNFAKYIGTNYCVGTANCLDSLYLSFRMIGIQEGDEVIVPANTFIATVMGISKNKGTPIFCEPDEFYNIDPARIEALITPKTKAICVVHLYGQICSMPQIMEIARKHNLYVIEDVAQAHGASINGKKAGSWGDIGCFSFYPTKNLGGFGDGGCLTFNDETYLELAKSLRNYGRMGLYHFVYEGINSRLDEIQAAFLNKKLEHFDELLEDRKRIAKRYLTEIKNPKIQLPKTKFELESHIWHLFVVATEKRDEFKEYLHQHGIGTIIHYPEPPHLSKTYAYLNHQVGDYPITETYANTILSLPFYNYMSDEEIDYVVKVINAY